MANGSDKQTAEKEAERFKEQTKNGIWWLQQKQKLLDLKYPCTLSGEEKPACTYEQLFGLNSAQMEASDMYATQRAAGGNCKARQALMLNAKQ